MSAALVIEVWLAGAVSLIWITLLIARIVEPTGTQLKLVFQYITSAPALFVFFFAGLAYVVGWAVSYLAEALLDPLFQTRFRDRYFRQRNLSFFEVRSKVFQLGAKDVIADIQYDRQLLRIVRSNVFNFMALGLVLLLYSIQDKLPIRVVVTFATACELFAVVSLLQWRFRYRSTFAKFLDLYGEITSAASNHGVAKKSNEKAVSDTKPSHLAPPVQITGQIEFHGRFTNLRSGHETQGGQGDIRNVTS